MSLFSGPAEHHANPPATWQVVKAGERRWQLQTAAGTVLDTYDTKRAAEIGKTDGFAFRLYDQETRWYAGEQVDPWMPYVPADPTWTFFGHWDSDRIVVEYHQAGEVADPRVDAGYWEQGLWAGSGSGPTVEQAQAAVIAEYESRPGG